MTLWMTLFMLYVANCVADLSAAATLRARDMSELRRVQVGRKGQGGACV